MVTGNARALPLIFDDREIRFSGEASPAQGLRVLA